MKNGNRQGWKECKLGELCSDIAYGYTESASLEPVGPKFLRITDIVPGRVNWTTVPYCKISDENRERYKLQLGDIVIARTGATTGYTYAIKPADLKHDAVFASYLIRYRIDKEKAEPFYVGHLLTSRLWDGFVEGILGGSAQPGANAKQFADFEIILPPLPEQCAIAGVLSSLDDKIDLLLRQNKTLEAMVETLFRQNFVETAEEVWGKIKIKDFDVIVTDFVANGSFASLKENVTLVTDREDYALFIRNTDLKSDFTTKVYVTEHSYNFLNKTKLFGGEVIISNVGDVGSVFRCPKFNIPMTLGNNVIMLKSYYSYFFYLFFKSKYGQGLINGITSGSVQEKFNKTEFRDLEINYPNIEYIREFEKSVSPYFNKIDLNKAQIRTLNKLRNTLLSKLMSGEVRAEIKEDLL